MQTLKHHQGGSFRLQVKESSSVSQDHKMGDVGRDDWRSSSFLLLRVVKVTCKYQESLRTDCKYAVPILHTEKPGTQVK